MENIYIDGKYWDTHPDYHSDDSEWKAKHLYSLLNLEHTSNLLNQQMSICEVGCGGGGVLYYLIKNLKEKKILCHGTGCDISPQAIERASSLFPECSFMISDIAQMQQCFDLILLIDVLEHVSNPKEMLFQCFERAKIVLVHLPLDDHYWGRLLRGKDYFDYLKRDRGHINYYTKDKAIQLMKDVNGEIIAWKYTRWGIELPSDNSKSGKLVKMLRHIGFNINMDISVKLFGGASIAILCKKS